MIAVNTIAEAIKKELWSMFSTDAHKFNDLIRYINSAARYIVISKNFPFNKYSHSITTNSVDSEYDIPYQIETFFVLNNSWEEVEILTYEDYFREQDKSNKVCVFEDKFITETPWTYKIFYRWFPETITSLTGNIKFPEHFYDCLVLGWTYYGFLDIQNYTWAGNKKAILDWLIKSLATRQSDKFPLNIKRMNRWNSTTF